MTVAVTDHAVLRYLERVLGFDIDGVRRVIAEECAIAAAMGATSTVKGDVTYQLAGGYVTTVHGTHKGGGRITNTHRRRAQEKIEAGGCAPHIIATVRE